MPVFELVRASEFEVDGNEAVVVVVVHVRFVDVRVFVFLEERSGVSVVEVVGW